jgi:hypothetical protein
MMKKFVIGAFIILLTIFAGCVYVNPLVQAGERNGSVDQTTAIQVCQITVIITYGICHWVVFVRKPQHLHR